jgi:hypothetical protein
MSMSSKDERAGRSEERRHRLSLLPCRVPRLIFSRDLQVSAGQALYVFRTHRDLPTATLRSPSPIPSFPLQQSTSHHIPAASMPVEAPPKPTGQKPTSYNDSFRGRSAHTEFADPCELARQVSGLPRGSRRLVEVQCCWRAFCDAALALAESHRPPYSALETLR